ncbi:MAG: tRNA (adenosine(37)-N6)-threonylcarbamoyltransferase complex dimerization subunit type 1 TsaB [Flavobacteriaceae bacterium]|nr:tRNA (adenosine(37)-N6)-threonylcarbamoyltransferase complex dimerization subunit type 1 TsaB [Flavobacteriaceae bacterium]
MALILNIETASKNCSVSISENGDIIALKEINEGGYTHAENLHPFIEEVLKISNLKINNIDAVAVSKGPGSYTGLRIGVSAAKGICFAIDKPLISIDTLKVLALQLNIENGYIIPMLDARRLEVYSSIFDEYHQEIRKTEAEILNEDSFINYLNSEKVYFLGDGSEKFKSMISHPNAIFIDNKFPSANKMGILSEEKFQKNEFENLAYFEPFYLKDFVTTMDLKKS